MRGQRRDLIGATFGRLVVRAAAPRKPGCTKSRWYCDCACGTKRRIVAGPNLLQGKTRSCGCLHREVMVRVQREWSARPRLCKPREETRRAYSLHIGLRAAEYERIRAAAREVRWPMSKTIRVLALRGIEQHEAQLRSWSLRAEREADL